MEGDKRTFYKIQYHLITDGAVKGVVDKEELHHSLSGFPGEV